MACAATILFRVNSGIGWVPTRGRARLLLNGDVVIPGGRSIPLGFGLINGKPAVGVGDLIGWHEVVITPEMVGRRVAVFLSIEAKRSEGGRVSGSQANWRDVVRQSGGIAGVASSEDEAREILRSWRPPLGPRG